MCGGGGGSSAPTQQTVTQVTIPPELMPYAKKVLGTAEGLAYGQPYQTYEGQRLAGLNPLQQQAMLGTAGLGPAQQLQQATGLAAAAGQKAGDIAGSYQAAQPQQMFQAPQMGKVDTAYQTVQAPQQGPAYQMAAPETFGTAQMQQYMSPYMQGVVEQQKRGAVQDYMRQMPGMSAAAVRAGARGGTREALLEAEAQRGLQERLGGIEATGLQSAYQQAAQQFGADRAAQMQAGQANLQAQINQAQFGAQQAMQAGQLNQAAQLQSQAQALQQQQGLNQLAMQGAGLGAQYGLAGQQLAEQSRQFGAGLGLQGLQQQLAAAGTLGQLGGAQFGQQAQALGMQQQAGATMQQLEQARLQAAYEDFLNRQRYPYQQLGFMSDLIRGTPTAGGIQSIYGSQTNPIGALVGLGGLYMAGRSG